jgi:serine/threonine-protein kinase RsbW
MIGATELTIRNDPAGVEQVRDALDRLGEEFKIPPRTLTQLQVALDEIVSNVIKYSWPDSGDHDLLVRITIHPERLDLEVFDDGVPFDPRNAPPVPSKDGGRPRPGGVGIHIVKQLVDAFAYERRDGRNHTTLTKLYSAASREREP